MTIPHIQIIEYFDKQRQEREGQEDRIIGKLYRELIAFENNMVNNALYNSIRAVINNTYKDAEYLGLDTEFLDGFVKRLHFYIGSSLQPIYASELLRMGESNEK